MMVALLIDLEQRAKTDKTVNEDELDQGRIWGYEELEPLVIARGLTKKVRDHFATCDYGVHDAGWLGPEECLAAFEKRPVEPRVAELIAMAEAGVGWWWSYETTVILTPRPMEYHTQMNRRGVPELHNPNGPAFVYPDGFGVKESGVVGPITGYYFNGTMVKPHVILAPQTISAKEVNAERNVEMRRILLTRMGVVRYLQELKVKPVHVDDTLNPVGPEELYLIPQPDDTPIAMIRVINGTPEPFGSTPEGDYLTKDGRWYKRYWLAVDPETKTVAQGVAASYKLTEQEYRDEFVVRT
jgi:hypothetical protein